MSEILRKAWRNPLERACARLVVSERLSPAQRQRAFERIHYTNSYRYIASKTSLDRLAAVLGDEAARSVIMAVRDEPWRAELAVTLTNRSLRDLAARLIYEPRPLAEIASRVEDDEIRAIVLKKLADLMPAVIDDLPEKYHGALALAVAHVNPGKLAALLESAAPEVIREAARRRLDATAEHESLVKQANLLFARLGPWTFERLEAGDPEYSLRLMSDPTKLETIAQGGRFRRAYRHIYEVMHGNTRVARCGFENVWQNCTFDFILRDDPARAVEFAIKMLSDSPNDQLG